MTESAPAVSNGKTKSARILDKTPVSGLPGWRDVIEPHHDVARGLYRKAESARLSPKTAEHYTSGIQGLMSRLVGAKGLDCFTSFAMTKNQ